MAIRAQGVITRGPGEPTTLEEFLIDAPGPQDVLVRLLASGVCHTDLKVKDGSYQPGSYPFLLGHEGAGVIEAIGSVVTTHKPGDHVILAWRAPCGSCRFCRSDRPNYCVASRTASGRMRTIDGAILTPVLGVGSFCTHTLVHADQALPYDAALPAPPVSLIGCGVMTGVGAALHAAQVKSGASVAVFGCGGVGMSVIMGAKLAGAAMIIAVDLDQRKLDLAQQFGATHSVNARASDPVDQIRSLTEGNGVDYAFEVVGSAQTWRQALDSLDLGGTCVIIGVPGPDQTLPIALSSFFNSARSLKVSWYGDCVPTRDFPQLAAWYSAGTLDLDRMVTSTIGLTDTEAAFSAMQRGDTLRSVIVFGLNDVPAGI